MSLLSSWKLVSDGVYVPIPNRDTNVVSVRSLDLEDLKIAARESRLKRARICTHQENRSLIHQMFIAIQKESYIHPHRHQGKAESFQMIEGEMQVVLFSEDGKVVETIRLSSNLKDSNCAFFYRLDRPLYHTLLIDSPQVVFQEITQGPFDPTETEKANWAPPEHDLIKSHSWMTQLREVCQNGRSN